MPSTTSPAQGRDRLTSRERLRLVGTAETVGKWVRQAEIDGGRRPGVTTEESAQLRRLRAEVRELRPADEILRAASAVFAAELDRSQQRSS